MNDLNNLYQDVIIDHNKQPRNFRVMNDADDTARGYNPLCGDQVTVYLKFDGDIITDASFQGCGCAISTASASMMTEWLRGKTVRQAENLFKQFHAVLMDAHDVKTTTLGKLEVLLGVKEFPSRVKCATLAWHALNEMIQKHEQGVAHACD